MKEINDKDFDQIFKLRMTEELPEFEEESWLKMEQKLRKKDRLVFYRYASAILLFLSIGLGFYLGNKPAEIEHQTIALGNKHKAVRPNVITEVVSKVPNQIEGTATNSLVLANDAQISDVTHLNRKEGQTIHPMAINELKAAQYSKNEAKKAVDVLTEQPKEISTAETIINTSSTTVDEVQKQVAAQVEKPENEAVILVSDQTESISEVGKNKPVIAKVKRKIPISLAISAGPDFNSASTLIGGKTSIAVGLDVGIGLTKKLSLHTGLAFGMKNYSGSVDDYNFANTKTTASSNPYTPAVQTTITEIIAACKVLEVPLVASFELTSNLKRSISLNAGLSSYFMLKEEYVYKYSETSGKKDRINDFTNANQHILSVVNLSATYNLKLKNKRFGFGIAPYVKIPLTGIGEGSVPLKSSGISLKLQYDVNKK